MDRCYWKWECIPENFRDGVVLGDYKSKVDFGLECLEHGRYESP